MRLTFLPLMAMLLTASLGITGCDSGDAGANSDSATTQPESIDQAAKANSKTRSTLGKRESVSVDGKLTAQVNGAQRNWYITHSGPDAEPVVSGQYSHLSAES